MAPDDDILSEEPRDGAEPGDGAVGDAVSPESAAEEGDGAAEKPKLSLQIEVTKPNACQRHVTVTIAREDIDRYMDEAFSELMPEAQVPGFRPGRAPRKLVESRFRREIKEKVKGSLLLDSISQATEMEKFSAISEPDFDFDAVEIPDEGSMTFEFDLEVRPEFDLPQWKGLTLKKPVRTHSREDVDAAIARMLRRYGEIVPYDGPAELDDFVTLNIHFEADGKLLSQAEELMVRVRPTLSFHDARFDGFGALIQGAKAGDRREAVIRLSDEVADEQLRGKEVLAKFEVLEVKRVETPALNEEFLHRLGGFANEGELRDRILEELNRQLEYRQSRSLRRQITEALLKDADWDLPQDLLRRQSRRELERAVLELKSAGFDDDAIRSHENELRQNSRVATARALKEHFILERIAEEEQIEDLPEDYDLEILRIAAQSDESPRRVRARIEKRGQMDVLRNQIIERKVIALITSHAQIEEVEEERPEVAAETVEAVDFTISGPEESAIPEAKPGGEVAALPQPHERV